MKKINVKEFYASVEFLSGTNGIIKANELLEAIRMKPKFTTVNLGIFRDWILTNYMFNSFQMKGVECLRNVLSYLNTLYFKERRI